MNDPAGYAFLVDSWLERDEERNLCHALRTKARAVTSVSSGRTGCLFLIHEKVPHPLLPVMCTHKGQTSVYMLLQALDINLTPSLHLRK